MKLSLPRLLDPNASFLDHYLHYCGQSEIPPAYNAWTGVALIAAAVADRVFVRKGGDPVYPNMYISLMGPSGIGKGGAIDKAMKLVMHFPSICVYNGRATPQYLFQFMGQSRNGHGELYTDDGGAHKNNKVWLMQEELSASVDKGEPADRFVKFMTENYTPRPYPRYDGTITRQMKMARDVCLNWLFGSIPEWAFDVFPPSAVSGGAWGRIIGVHADYDFDARYEDPIVPPDIDDVVGRLHDKLTVLTQLEGEIIRSDKAKHIMTEWYRERAAPTDMALAPAWRRQHDLVYKLSMIHALSRAPLQLRITSADVTAGLALSDEVMRNLAEIQMLASSSPQTASIAWLRRKLKSARSGGRHVPLHHSKLLGEFWKKGLGGEDVFRAALETLKQSREISQVQLGPKTGLAYVWQMRRRMPIEPTEEAP